MTEQQIIETLATKVMEWEEERDFAIVNDKIFVRPHTDFIEWNPLQNLADAWQVVEKLREQTYFFALSYAEDDEKYTWQADFDYVSVKKIGKGKTAQEAICNAALKVVSTE